MISRLFKASSTITTAAFVLSISGLLSRILGVYRDRLLATTFGAGSALDAYYAAFRIPDFIFNLLVLGALSAGFIPVFSELFESSKKKAWKLSQSVFLSIVIVLISAAIIIFFFAPQLVSLIAPGFEGETLNQTVVLTRIMLLSPIFLGVSSVFGGVLQSFKRFLAYSFAPIIYNFGIIIGIFAFVPTYGLTGLAWGVVLGSGLHMLLQGWVAIKLGWRISLFPFWRQEGLREILVLMGPRTLSLAVTQINVVVITAIASQLQEGSLSIFNLAQNLAYVPKGLFGISFALAAFPVMSKFIAQGKHDDFIATINKTILQISFFLFPSMIVFLLLDEQLVRLVLGAGEFDWQSTLLTAQVLQVFMIAIIAQSFLPLFNRVYYAHKNTITPLYASIAGLVSNLVFGLWFSKSMGLSGLVLGYGIASLIQVGILFLGEYMHAHRSKDSHVIKEVIKMLLACFVMAVVMQLTKHQIGPNINLLTVRGVLIHFLIPCIAGGLVYLLGLRFLKSEEYAFFEQILKTKSQAMIRPLLPALATSEEDDLYDG